MVIGLSPRIGFYAQAAHHRLFNHYGFTRSSGSGAHGRMAPRPHSGGAGRDAVLISRMDGVVVVWSKNSWGLAGIGFQQAAKSFTSRIAVPLFIPI